MDEKEEGEGERRIRATRQMYPGSPACGPDYQTQGIRELAVVQANVALGRMIFVWPTRSAISLTCDPLVSGSWSWRTLRRRNKPA
jgi:hypothetical protein